MEASKALPRKFLFQGPSVVELFQRLAEAGPETARFEVRFDDGLTGKPTLRVVGADGKQLTHAASGEVLPDINESHPCPPDCPDGEKAVV